MRRSVTKAAVLATTSLAWFGLSAQPARADNGPHERTTGNMTTARCASCHRAHTGQAADLLPASQPEMCYSCHGSAGVGATTAVQEGVSYELNDDGTHGAPMGALRGGGFEFALIDTDGAVVHGGNTGVGLIPVGDRQATTSSHSVDGSSRTVWGGGAIGSGPGPSITLTCGSCHDPHGNGNYRVLRPDPQNATHSPGATGWDIVDDPDRPHVYTTTNYWNVYDSNQPTFGNHIEGWCAQCHTRYMARDWGQDSGDPIYAHRHLTNGTPNSGIPNCVTCHVAHGSNASMTGWAAQVPNPDPNVPVEGGGSRLLRVDNRGVCQMCHDR